MNHHGIVIAEHGAAIVTVERSADDALLVTGIERLPFSLTAVTARVRAPEDPEAHHVLDAEGLGTALWAVLGPPEDAAHWTLYTGRGQERQALVDALLVAMEEDRFRFAAGLAEMEPMGRALLAFRRHVREDGLIGSELVVALLLAVMPPPPGPVPSVYETRGIWRI